jgi:hypothetical protein
MWQEVIKVIRPLILLFLKVFDSHNAHNNVLVIMLDPHFKIL